MFDSMRYNLVRYFRHPSGLGTQHGLTHKLDVFGYVENFLYETNFLNHNILEKNISHLFAFVTYPYYP